MKVLTMAGRVRLEKDKIELLSHLAFIVAQSLAPCDI